MQELKQRFPIFSNNPDLTYLDNSATTQKPQQVIDAITDYYTNYNANVYRGIYSISEQATNKFEESRAAIAELINCSAEEIVFTSGASEALNGIAYSLLSSEEILPENPTIFTSDAEHNSAILPWRYYNPKAELHYLPITDDYQVDFTQLESAKHVDIVSLSLVSNITGAILDAKKLVEIIRSKNPKAVIILDASQAIGHIPVNVAELAVDFIIGAGHKMYGPTGVGFFYGNKDILNKIPPFKYGGGMISKVDKHSAVWAAIPRKFEAGTQPIAQVIGLGAAVEFIQELGVANIRAHEQHLVAHLMPKLELIDGIEIFHPADYQQHAGVIAFGISGVHPHDLAQLLADQQVAVRAGHHCAEIFHREVIDTSASARVSFASYNTTGDIDKFIQVLKSAVDLLQG